jgi:TRAP-type mannitol/chloroaromatic compound transport system substrate-binding protein
VVAGRGISVRQLYDPRPLARLIQPAIAQSAPEVKWRLTSSFPKSLDTIYGGAEMIAKQSPSDRQQVPDPGVRGGRDRPRPAGARRGRQNGTVEMCHTALLLLLSARIRPSPSARPVPFGLNARQQNAWLYPGGGIELFNEFYKETRSSPSRRQHRHADGRLVPQGDQDGRPI